MLRETRKHNLYAVLTTPFAAHSNLLYLWSGVDGPRTRWQFRRLAWNEYRIKITGTLANIFFFFKKTDRNILRVDCVGCPYYRRIRLTACLAGHARLQGKKSLAKNNPKTRWNLKTGKTNFSAPTSRLFSDAKCTLNRNFTLPILCAKGARSLRDVKRRRHFFYHFIFPLFARRVRKRVFSCTGRRLWRS